MTFALGCLLGFALAGGQLLLTVCLLRTGVPPRRPRRPALPATPDPRTDDDERARRRALREYRNFMTYDGYTPQGGDDR